MEELQFKKITDEIVNVYLDDNHIASICFNTWLNRWEMKVESVFNAFSAYNLIYIVEYMENLE